jgi:hypothetical protein
MLQTTRLVVLVVVCAVGLVASPADAATDAFPRVATPAEEVKFGVGLVVGKYHFLGIDVLESVWPRLDEKKQKARAAHNLASAYEVLARRRYLGLDRDVEANVVRGYRQKADHWRTQAKRLGGAPIDDIETLMRRRHAAMGLAQRASVARSATEKQQLLKQLQAEFAAILGGMGELVKKAAAAKKEWEDKEPGWDQEREYQRWKKSGQPLQERHLRHSVELERTRYEYYKALAIDTGSKKLRAKLLKTVIRNLEDLVYMYDRWAYSIPGNLTLANAFLDAGKPVDAGQAAHVGLELIVEYIRANPRLASTLAPSHYKLQRAWAIAHARQNEFQKAIDRVRGKDVATLKLTHAECLLLWAEYLQGKKQAAAASARRTAAGRLLDALFESHPETAPNVESLRRRFGLSGSGFPTAWIELERAVRARDNPLIIEKAIAVIEYGEEAPAEKRSVALQTLATASYQERRFLEAAVVYEHLARVVEDDERAAKFAKYVLGCMQKRAELTGDPVDKALLEEARTRLEDKYEGPGIEYRRAGELKKEAKTAADFARVAEAYGRVPKDSLYYEPALHQKGENYIRAAKLAEKANGPNVDQYLAQGKAGLDAFLKAIQKPTIHERVKSRRRRLRSAAVYRLADVAMWEGREDYKACLELTKSYAERFPDAKQLLPFVLWLRARAAIGLGQLVQAEVDLAELRNVVDQGGLGDQGARLVGYAADLLFSAYVKSAGELRKEAEALRRKAAETGPETDQGKQLLEQAVNKENQSHEHSDRALTIMRSAIDAHPETATYDKLLFVIYELDRQKRQNELPEYIEQFRKVVQQLAREGTLTAKQREEIAVVRAMQGFALYERGEYETAYKVLKPQYETLDKAWDQARMQNRKAKPDPQYGSIALYFARSAQRLADAPRRGNEYGNEALRVYFKLWGVLRDGSQDWWDVTVSIAETWNALGLYTKNITAAKRFVATRPELGGADVRKRYAGVLEEVFKRSNKPKQRASAFQLLVDIRGQDLKALSAEKRYADMLTVMESLRALRPDVGGKENVENLRRAAQYVAEKADDDQVKADAVRLLEQLK